MAIDKVIDSAKLDIALTATANAIREKNGTTDPIAWDNNTGFATAVENIEAGDTINNQDITVTENGTYTAGTGYTGLGTVEVSVPTGGGGTELVDAIINRSVTEANSNVDRVGAYAFCSCSSLTSANFPAATNIGTSAFASCRSLTEASFPACITIGDYAFINCSSLTEANFPAVTSIGSYAFYNCPKLTTADFPVATSIGSYAFYNCSSLSSVNFPAAMNIGSEAFRNCSSLTEVNFPAVTGIANSAFQYCSSLTEVNFPVATSIGVRAFATCSSLTTVNFPEAITIGSSAFQSCAALASLYLMGSSLCTLLNSNAFSKAGITSSAGAIYVPASLLASYQSATNWAYFSTQFVAGD